MLYYKTYTVYRLLTIHEWGLLDLQFEVLFKGDGGYNLSTETLRDGHEGKMLHPRRSKVSTDSNLPYVLYFNPTEHTTIVDFLIAHSKDTHITVQYSSATLQGQLAGEEVVKLSLPLTEKLRSRAGGTM